MSATTPPDKPPATPMSRDIRDADIHFVSHIDSLLNNDPEAHFILTGSYAIEALTNGNIYHNDIDANIFAGDIPRSLARTAQLLDASKFHDDLRLKQQTDTRLEYSLQTPAAGRDLEIQFAQARVVTRKEDGIEFAVETRDKLAKVPTTLEALKDSRGTEFTFRVKSLPYAIATWALRISGIASSQKRAVRDSDIEHFVQLLSAEYQEGDVLSALRDHPQMPDDFSPEQVIAHTLKITKKHNDTEEGANER